MLLALLQLERIDPRPSRRHVRSVDALHSAHSSCPLHPTSYLTVCSYCLFVCAAHKIAFLHGHYVRGEVHQALMNKMFYL